MDINQLEVLVSVSREQSFSRAAKALHRTQPAISQAIRRLELEIGESLFDRSSKDGTLTAAGRVLLDYLIESRPSFMSNAGDQILAPDPIPGEELSPETGPSGHAGMGEIEEIQLVAIADDPATGPS